MSEAAAQPTPLLVGSVGRRASGWWGMVVLIITEVALFAYLLFSYFYFSVRAHTAWPPSGLPSFRYSLPATVVLLASSAAIWWTERGARRGARAHVLLGLLVTVALGLGYIALQVLEWHSKPFTLSTDTYGSLFFTITGLHLAHAAVGVIILSALMAWTGLGYFSAERYAPVSIGALYWNFVTAVWIAVFLVLYITPYG